MPTLPAAVELCQRLADLMRPHVTPATALVGIHTGGVWIAEWLHKELGLVQPPGSMNVSFYRDDYHQRGLHGGRKPSAIPFDVADAHIVIVDDVLYTGRTIRAALDELADFGRPRRIALAVLIDRGGRELPIQPDIVGKRITLEPSQRVDVLVTELDGRNAAIVADREPAE